MSNELNERWLPVPGYEGAYSVSDLGRVRSDDRQIIDKTGKSYVLKGKILRPGADGHGYLRVNLSSQSVVRSLSVHGLVMLAFVGPRPDKADVCHGDGNHLNNRLTNLRYDTRAANIMDSQKHGTFSEAEIHPVAILTNEQALAIYNTAGIPGPDLALEYGVSVAVINQIWRGDSWASVTGGRSVILERGVRTYLRTKLTWLQACIALANRANRTGRKDGRGVKPTAASLGVDADVIKALYAAIDSGKPIIFAK